MPTRISTALGISKLKLKNKGVYDSMIDFDSRLHIDPATLSKCSVPEFLKANEKVDAYFKDVLLLVKSSKKHGDIMWNTALKKLPPRRWRKC